MLLVAGKERGLMMKGVTGFWAALAILSSGCTVESTRIAIETQRRVDDVQQTIVQQQNDGLRSLLFRQMVQRASAAGEPLSEEQVEQLNLAWNERDLLEFWMIQNERALGLRRVGVDAKLYGDQSVVDLLWKSIDAKIKRAEQAAAAAQGAALQPNVAGSQPAESAGPPVP